VPTPPETAPVQEGLAAASPWLALALLLVACAGVAGLWVLALRARGLERLAPRLDALEEIRAALARLSSQREDLDLRRIAHVLIELRDGQRRLEDALLRSAQTARPASAPDLLPAAAREGGAAIAERVVNRLLAMGYEHVQLVTAGDDLERLARGEPAGNGAGDPAAPRSGEVLVEARRAGVLCKGRVLVRAGALAEVQMQPAYNVFP
jgi:hypothetical protein